MRGKVKNFQDQDYTPAYLLSGLPVPLETELTTPERTLVRLAAAVEALDWDMSNALWDPVSRALYEREMAKDGTTPQDRVKGWKEAYGGKQLEAYRMRRVPGYVMIFVGRVGESAADREHALPFALKQDQMGRWWLTHDLRGDVVYGMDLYLPSEARLVR
jgi:hypothetical protein